MNAREVNDLLKSRAEDFCSAFLPSGTQVGNQWRCADIYGNPSKAGKPGSFAVELQGDRMGAFHEFNAADRTAAKSLVDVYMAVQGYGQDRFSDALKELKGWLGVADLPMKRSVPIRVTEARKSLVNKVDWKPVRETSKAGRYLREKRGILDFDVLRRYDVGECETWYPGVTLEIQGKRKSLKIPSVVFPAWECPKKQKLLLVKYKSIDKWRLVNGQWATDNKNGSRLVRTNKGTTSKYYHLIGWQNVLPGIRQALICEGEEDMLSWASIVDPDTGKPVVAMSMPFGAKSKSDGKSSGNQWIDNDWECLEEFEDIVLAFDGDESGRSACREVAPRLHLDRVSVVNFEDGEDANSVWLRDPQALGELLDNKEPTDPERLKRALDFREQIYEEFFPPDGVEPGFTLPIGGDFFRFRPGETTVWTGYSKNGKTIAQTYTLVHLASEWEQRCCVASLEMPARKTLKNALRMAFGREKPIKSEGEPDLELFNRGMSWMNDFFFVYDKVGEVLLDDVLEVFRYAARRYGVTQFVIDSLMKLDCHEEDHDRQKEVLNQVTAFAREFDVHVHFVAHSKKGTEKRPEEKYPPRKHDVLGSVHITNIPDNILVIWRNRHKEHVMDDYQKQYEQADRDGKEELMKKLDDALREKWMEKDATWIVEGQRHGSGLEGARWSWFDTGKSWQYFSSHEDRLAGAREFVK